LLTLCIHFGFGGELIMDWSPDYLGPMLYLTIFGSILAFGCYMLLIGRIGADYAAYVMLLVPVLALLLSTIFEGYHWRMNNIFGIILVLMGNLVILSKPRTVLRLFRRLFPITA
jgi:drug/metabolite transporter (DMT)-like permease